jgi:hypothetical protein
MAQLRYVPKQASSQHLIQSLMVNLQRNGRFKPRA